MPRRREPKDRHDEEERKEERAEERDEEREEGEGRRGRPHPEGREWRVFEEQIEKRLGGGAPPSPETYARALEQWNQLPGAVMRPPTDVVPPAPEPPDDIPQDDADEGEGRP
jgi:hypothetical protein